MQNNLSNFFLVSPSEGHPTGGGHGSLHRRQFHRTKNKSCNISRISATNNNNNDQVKREKALCQFAGKGNSYVKKTNTNVRRTITYLASEDIILFVVERYRKLGFNGIINLLRFVTTTNLSY